MGAYYSIYFSLLPLPLPPVNPVPRPWRRHYGQLRWGSWDAAGPFYQPESIDVRILSSCIRNDNSVKFELCPVKIYIEFQQAKYIVWFAYVEPPTSSNVTTICFSWFVTIFNTDIGFIASENLNFATNARLKDASESKANHYQNERQSTK